MSELAPPAADALIEEGDPATDGRAFRRCLGQYPTGVAVITACCGDKLVGMAVNSFAAVSLDPPLVLWSIRRESSSATAFCEASHVAVNVLASRQVDVSQWFGSGHPERFELARWNPDPHGSPLLEGAIAHLQCRREGVLDGGDHFIVVLRVERFARYQGEPLLFAQGQYAVAHSHPNLSPAAAAAPSARPCDDEGASLLRLLSTANQRMSMQFQKHRQALGLNPSSTRVLNSLRAGPRTSDQLEQETYLGPDAIEDTLADLLGQGHVRKAATGLFELTPSGREKNAAVAERSAAFTQEKLHGIADADIAAAERVLLALRAR